MQALINVAENHGKSICYEGVAIPAQEIEESENILDDSATLNEPEIDVSSSSKLIDFEMI